MDKKEILMSKKKQILLIYIFLVAATLIAFWQLNHCDFTIYDDESYVTKNGHLRDGITANGIRWALTSIHCANWHPLTWISHMLDVQLFGLYPQWHHLTNLFLHVTNTMLLFIIFHRSTKVLWESAFVAALFALHPLHVESVAWVAERKDVLSTFFWMLTMLTYVYYVERPGFNRYLLVFLCFTLGLMSKPMLVTLPFVLLLFDYWPLGRFQWGPLSGDPKSHTSKSMNPGDQKSLALRLIREKAPFFALCAVSCVLTIFAQQEGGAVVSLEYCPLENRIANALVSYVSYIEKMIWPRNLVVFYPYQMMVSPWKVVSDGLLLVCVSLLVIRAVRKFPCLVVGWFWFLGTLIPVIGLVQVGSQTMADRYTYVPLIGLFIMIAWSVPDILVGWRYRRVVLSISVGVLLLLMMIVTKLQVRHWQNGITLFEHSVAVTPDNSTIHNYLGYALAEKGKIQEAMDHYAEALRIKPSNVEAHNNLGITLARQGKIQEAMAHYAEALRIKPNYVEAHNNLGNLFLKQGKYQEAIDHYKEALRININSAEVQNNLAWALATAKTPGLRDGKKALELSLKAYKLFGWENPEVLDTLAAAYARVGEFDRAVKLQKKVLESPQFPKDKDAQQRLNFYRQGLAWPSD